MKKVNNKKGFTLMEMTVCILTLALVGLICTTGYSLAMRSYNDSKFESNSQMLESMLNISLGDVLRYAYEVRVLEDGTVIFNNDDYKLNSIEITVENGRLVYNGYKSLNELEEAHGFLVSTYSYVDGLYIDEDSFTLKYIKDQESEKEMFRGSYTICCENTSQKKVVEFKYISIIDKYRESINN